MLGKPASTMKRTPILTLVGLVFSGSLALAALPGVPDFVPVRINQTDEARFPNSLIAVGIKSGAASIAIAVDDSGKLTDYVVTAYTHPAFADNAVAALKKWTFEPAQIHGSPRNSKSDLTFRFEVEGVVVVTLTPITYVELRRFQMAPDSQAFAAVSLGQLDRIPTPSKIVNPIYPTGLARRTRGGHVSVEFYIDPTGHVRIPSVTRETNEANEELAAIAVTTVAQWEFEPPMVKGRPVLVQAKQDFEFKPAPDATAAAKIQQTKLNLDAIKSDDISRLAQASVAKPQSGQAFPFELGDPGFAPPGPGAPVDTKGFTIVSSHAYQGYSRTSLPDGSYQPETYAFGNGGKWETSMVDPTIDHLSFDDIAQTIAGPLRDQNYLPAEVPDKTKLLIVLYWGTTSGSAESPGFSMPSRVASHGNIMITGAAELNDVRNARMLGFDFPSAMSPFKIDPLDLVTEIESNRYFVGLVAYDFQLLWKEKVRKVLWVTRYSIREHRNEFDRDLPAISLYASQFFGQDSHGFVVKRIADGRVDVGPVKNVDAAEVH
jgi:TonB family protein